MNQSIPVAAMGLMWFSRLARALALTRIRTGCRSGKKKLARCSIPEQAPFRNLQQEYGLSGSTLRNIAFNQHD
jgi:hypothetical protein